MVGQQGSMLSGDQRKDTMMRGFGVALLVVESLVAIGLLAQLPHASAAQDDAGVRSNLWIGGGSLVLVFGWFIGGFNRSFAGDKSRARPAERLLPCQT
jgi:hypothetical protein